MKHSHTKESTKQDPCDGSLQERRFICLHFSELNPNISPSYLK